MTRMVPASGREAAELCVDVIGDDTDRALLLIGGNACSLDYWDDELCGLLASRGLRVIRYDHRDTGLSTASPAGAPNYTSRALIEDAIAVLDGLGVDRAHVAGLSMGGAIAQELGLAHRGRIRSLTLMSTSFAKDGPEGLPPPTLSGEPAEPDWSDRAAVIDHLVATERLYAGDGWFDEARTRTYAERVLDRTRDIEAASRNHMLTEPGAPVPGRTADLAGIPTLVVHGAADPLFPIEHGRALAAAIPGAHLLELEGVGHQLPPPRDWRRLAEALLEVVADR